MKHRRAAAAETKRTCNQGAGSTSIAHIIQVSGDGRDQQAGLVARNFDTDPNDVRGMKLIISIAALLEIELQTCPFSHLQLGERTLGPQVSLGLNEELRRYLLAALDVNERPHASLPQILSVKRSAW